MNQVTRRLDMMAPRPTFRSRSVKFRLSLVLVAPAICMSLSIAQAQQDAAANAAKEPGAVVTTSGLVYRSLKDGTGASPSAADVVKVHYRGTFPDGKEFDSSIARGKPAEFPLNGVIKCWTEGVQRMKVGGKAKLTCPASIAYGERGAGGGLIPANATLHFDIELLGIAGK
jgi:FKBP-type peptidyl-prolyl cis-trans isomerase FkpA